MKFGWQVQIIIAALGTLIGKTLYSYSKGDPFPLVEGIAGTILTLWTIGYWELMRRVLP